MGIGWTKDGLFGFCRPKTLYFSSSIEIWQIKLCKFKVYMMI